MFEEIDQLAKERLPNGTKEMGVILHFLARLMKAETTLEIGVEEGYVSTLLAQASKKHYAIEEKEDRCDRFRDYLDKKGIKNVEIINKNSLEVDWDKEVDLIFQDSYHRNPELLEEIKKYAPYVKKDGFFCCHDYYWKPGDVKEVVDNYFKEGWEVINIPYYEGLTICRKL